MGTPKLMTPKECTDIALQNLGANMDAFFEAFATMQTRGLCGIFGVVLPWTAETNGNSPLFAEKVAIMREEFMKAANGILNDAGWTCKPVDGDVTVVEIVPSVDQ